MTRVRKPLRINYLSQGMESPAKIDILLSVTKIKRPELIAGLKDYYCRGYSKVDAAAINGVASQNMSSPIAKLDQVAEAFEKYIELKANELTSSKLTSKQQAQAKQHENFNKEYLE